MTSKSSPNRAPKATLAEDFETLIFNDSCKEFNDFEGPRLTFWGQKWVQHWIRIAPSTRKPSESLLEASWNALEALLEAFGAQKSNWKRRLDGPRPPRRLVSALPGGQIPSQKEPRRVPNRGPKTIRAENSKTLIFNDSCGDFNDFWGPRLSF